MLTFCIHLQGLGGGGQGGGEPPRWFGALVKETEEELCLRLETRKRVQTNEAKSKRRCASPGNPTGTWYLLFVLIRQGLADKSWGTRPRREVRAQDVRICFVDLSIKLSPPLSSSS